MLQLENISKTYRTTEIETRALVDVSLEIQQGEFLAIMGPSGCGKSTLLNILGLLDVPTSGTYRCFGEVVSNQTEKQLTALRRAHIGFIFQSFNLIDDLTIAENVEVALLYRGIPAAERRKRIADALERVGMSHRAKHLPRQLSGGQQQRAAVARAFVAEPKLILADEPTGNLDSANGDAVMELLTSMAANGTSVVMVTHSLAHAAIAQRKLRMLDGQLISESRLAA
jgi:putative ABC transport system ATP-binding protein